MRLLRIAASRPRRRRDASPRTLRRFVGTTTRAANGQHELLRALDLRQPRVRLLVVVVEPRRRPRHAHEDLRIVDEVRLVAFVREAVLDEIRIRPLRQELGELGEGLPGVGVPRVLRGLPAETRGLAARVPTSTSFGETKTVLAEFCGAAMLELPSSSACPSQDQRTSGRLVSAPRAYAAYSANDTKRVRIGGSSHSCNGARSFTASSSAP